MPVTLLIAENDPDLAALYRKHLIKSGYRALTASDGAECLAIIRNDTPAVLIAAVDLTCNSNRGLVDCLREESRQRPVPSVILTGSIPYDLAADGSEPFLIGYIAKPVALSELLDYVRRALARPNGWRIFRVGECLE